MIGAVQDHLKNKINNELEKDIIDKKYIKNIFNLRPRIEKIAIKDAKLRTFITSDNARDDLVAHVYDVTYGVVNKEDNLVVIDDSIVRGTTLKKSILTMLDRLSPKKIIILSSAPQIRYPDCYGIDMAKLDDFIAFKAALKLHEENGTKQTITKKIYNKCLSSKKSKEGEVINYVKMLYSDFTQEQISDKIATILKGHKISSKVKIIFQSIEGLHKACPYHKGDWYFTGDYPTPGGSRIANNAFINYYEGKSQRAY